MVFSNSFGFFNKKSVFINKTNLDLSFKEVASIEIVKKKKVNYKVGVLLLIEVILFLIFYDELSEMLKLFGLIVVFSTLLFFTNIKEEMVHLKIILCIPKQIFIKIDSNEIEEAKDFTNRFALFRNFNTELD